MATYYVGPGGNDGSAGTSWGARKLTIQAAVNVATTAADTIYVGPGTYRETVTMGTSGTAGNVISLIGDYTGANTSGTKGIVRITGSAADQTATRGSNILATSKSYITISGFVLDLTTTHNIILDGCDHITISNCYVADQGASTNIAIYCKGAAQAAVTISRCYVQSSSNQGAIMFDHTATVDNTGHVVENCVIMGAQALQAVRISRVGGVTVRNTTIGLCSQGIRVITALSVGQTITVNNCLIWGCTTGLFATAVGEITEDYNNITPDTSTLRTNTSAGANSISRAVLFDPRWFFEAVNGGRLITPFDLASYSTLVEYNSGTGAPSTDLRGASVVGTYREWGALEYDAGYTISGGAPSITPG